MSWFTSELRVRLVPWNRFKPSSKIFLLTGPRGTSFVRLFICASWSPVGKGLTSWLSFVVSNCEFVTFPLVSLVRCGTWLYRFLIFAPLLTLEAHYSATSWNQGCYKSLCMYFMLMPIGNVSLLTWRVGVSIQKYVIIFIALVIWLQWDISTQNK